MPDYKLTLGAEDDLLGIARYTIATWGAEQARRYERLLENHFRAIARNAVRTRVFLKHRPDLLFTHCEHHYVFHILLENKSPVILAVFHENMDLMTRIKQRLQE